MFLLRRGPGKTAGKRITFFLLLRAYTHTYSTLLVQMRIEWGFKMQRGGEGETPPRSLHTHLNEENSWLRICEVWDLDDTS